MSILARIEFTLTIQGRFLTASSSSLLPGIDVTVSKTDDNRLLLPGSLVKGKVREALYESAKGKQWAKAWLLDKGASDSQITRGRIRFHDFKTTKPITEPIEIDTRISVDCYSGSVREGMLVSFESPIKSGQSKTFTGVVEFVANSQSEIDEVKRYLTTGLRLVTQFGANYSTGFGRVTHVEANIPLKTDEETIDSNKNPTSTSIGTQATVARRYFSLKPNNSFCIAKPRVADNLFESETHFSGSVIKGVIASMINELSGRKAGGGVDIQNCLPSLLPLAEALSDIVFTSAYPAVFGSSILPTIPPLSLVQAKKLTEKANCRFRDVSLCEHPILLKDAESKEFVSPSFSVDWKGEQWAHVTQQFQIPSLRRELRVRTAINSENRRAEEGQLFAHDMVRPDEHQWLGAIDLSSIDSSRRQAIWEAFEYLVSSGVWGIGKTKATARWNFLSSQPEPAANLKSSTNPVVVQGQALHFWIVTLQSPAILHNPVLSHFEDLATADHPNYQTREELLAVSYSQYWEQVSSGAIQLERFFASQSLAGGEYYARRFLKSSGNNNYQPYVVTNSGSVFVLSAEPSKTAQVASLFDHWSAVGLPLPSFLGDNLRFDQCPFRPQEGFGQIRVNMPIHNLLLPSSEECEVIQ